MRQENALGTLNSGGWGLEEGFPWLKASTSLGGGDCQDPTTGMASERGHRHANVWGYHSTRHHGEFEELNTLHPSLPPNALWGASHDLLKHVDAPMEVVGRQTAEILRAVETKVKEIQVREWLIRRDRTS